VYGEPDAETAEAFYQHCSRFATGLQVPRHMWPATLADFQTYWDASTEQISIDEPSREFLLGILEAGFLPRPLPRLLGPAIRFMNVGFLPEPFRRAMGLTWTPTQQARHDRFLARLAVLNRCTPGALRRAPIYLNLWDMRLRHRFGARLT